MADSKFRSVSAAITEINDRFLLLSSAEIPPGYFVKISALFSMVALGRQSSPVTARLADNFQVGDMFHLEVSHHTNYYIPSRIHAMKLFRSDGTHVIGFGLVVYNSETTGPIIRTTIIPDFECPKDRCVIPEIKKGDVVHFEALVSGQTIEGRWLSILPPDSKQSVFPIDRKLGVVYMNQVTGNLELRLCNADATTTSIPLYPGAYFGCGAPAKALLGRRVIGTICPRRPHLSLTDLEVIYFEADFDSVVPRSDRMPAAALDCSSSFGMSLQTGHSFQDVQCSRYFNQDTMKMLRDSFLFAFDHSDPEKFDDLIRRYPKLVSVVLSELGVGEGAIYEGSGDDLAAKLKEVGRGRLPVLPTQGYERLDSGDAPNNGAAATVLTPQFTHSIAVIAGQPNEFFSENATAISEQRRESLSPHFHPSEVFGPDTPMDDVALAWRPVSRMGSTSGQSQGSINDSWTAGNGGNTERQVTHLRGKIKPG